ncbi:MAG: phosphate acyltransferase PlsX [Alphaproteobacteria bacterium]|nr:phosphate acyltransferase PlsX [Alphaproteobacteria bacterium]
MKTEQIILAVDAMGGDNAPDIVIDGIRLALRDFAKTGKDVFFKLFGDENKVKPLLAKYRIPEDKYELIHTPDYIKMDDKVAIALRSGKKSSLWLANEAVKRGEASAVVSSGNTGCLMAFSKVILGTMSGIHRPALVSLMPTKTGVCVMLDLGANTECDARNLVEFAIMGDAYAKAVLKIGKPSIGILNIGSEEMKGKEELRQASRILRQTALAENFVGFVEPDDIGKNRVDVVVADGFSGNIALKAIEGTARLVFGLLKEYIKGSLLAKIGLPMFIPALKRMKNKMNPGRYNGAMFIGLKGISIKSHGGSDAFGFANALKVSVDAVSHDLKGCISTQLDNINFDEIEQRLANENEQK